ncbi:MAG TPA: ABC transporter permease subunit [Kiritimatiellia bacterium]|nr:ABC transporter permease subunit [Kiritimatiellia bacterium]HRZ11201.1 ABC transporter permease subunit [Kiritimatiellia bacterium]HSA19052.1 ABC transporter permease subunit [Kiritimatiellia bacterium]
MQPARNRKTRWAVRASDSVSRGLITVGGIGTIVAVFTVCLFLVAVALPLFRPPSIRGAATRSAPARLPPLLIQPDEDGRRAWALAADGSLSAFQMNDSSAAVTERVFSNAPITAVSTSPDGANLALGFEDGTVRRGRVGWAEGAARADFGEAAAFSPPSPVRLLAHAGESFCALTADGRLFFEKITERRNLVTGEVTPRRRAAVLPYEPRTNGEPSFLLLSGLADWALLAWPDGLAIRYNTRQPEKAFIEETLNLLDDPALRLTAMRCLPGQTTVLSGDSGGRVRAWFPVRPDGTNALTRLVAAREFRGAGAPVACLATAGRMRVVAIGYADGSVRVGHVTSGKTLARLPAGPRGPAAALAFLPRDNGLLAIRPDGLSLWRLDPRHPEATWKALFAPIWYEGAPRPAHTWQSSAATDDFEPKLGLVPLIFGTLKATLYALLFGVPVALLAAVFTSEFLHPRARRVVKPAIEMMASLPSVVLGFFGAIVIAPFVETAVPAVLVSLVTVPVMFLAGAHVWQLLPPALTLRLASWRLLLLLLLLPLGLAAAAGLGPVAERLLFAGDMRRWLDGQLGGPAGGWFFLMLAPAALAAALIMARAIRPRLQGAARSWPRSRVAAADALAFLADLALTGGLAWASAGLLTAAGWDPRGAALGTYVQRNALIVGFVMGFAVIPVVYTIADDALAAVPDHLRSAALGAGATPWQTAVTVIIPTAMSGLFSAVMIGLGRAVGETMIVLMAAGNTPIMDWNPFNGFRTLSANIAVELPEAVRNSTHYRVLFLSALVLFALTFVINTAAELVRLRFRRKAVAI